MDAKAACHKAKDYIADLFADEGVTNIGLEEVEFESTSYSWRITIGFSRPWDHKNPLTAALGAVVSRSYKVIRINDRSGEVESLTDRFPRPERLPSTSSA